MDSCRVAKVGTYMHTVYTEMGARKPFLGRVHARLMLLLVIPSVWVAGRRPFLLVGWGKRGILVERMGGRFSYEVPQG